MINRRALVCASCSAKTVTRTAIGHGDRQEHEFACPGCGVTISFVLHIDQEAIDFSYSEPQNAKWCDSVDGAKATLSFDAERVVPSDLPPFISPYIATFHKLSDPGQYAADEVLRQQWRDLFWPRVKRALVHFENDNDTLFDNEVAPLELPVDRSTKGGRLTLLNRLQDGGFSRFAMVSRGQRGRIRQRLALAESISESLVDQLTESYATSGRIDSLWREIRDVRDAFLKQYDALSPLVQLRYWRTPPQDHSEVILSTKRFDPLRQLHIDTFETVCRLLVMGIGLELIIRHKALTMPTRKGEVSL